MKDTALTKTKVNTRARELENTQAGLDAVSKGSIIVMGAVSALIGLWAVASFFGAMITGGGPLVVIEGWFRAVTGM